MDKYNPYASLLPDLTGELFGAGAVSLPPMAGASPGLFDELSEIGNAVVAYTINPVLDWTVGHAGGVVRDAWAAAQGALTVLLRQGLRTANNALAGAYGTYWYVIFTQRLALDRFTAGDLFGSIMEALWHAVEAWVSTIGGWVRDRIVDGLGYAAGAFVNMGAFVTAIVSNHVNWLRDRVVDGLGYAGAGFLNMGAFATSIVSNHINWLRDRVVDGLGYAGAGFLNMGAFVTGIVSNHINWLRDRVNDSLGFVARGVPDMARFIETARDVGLTWVKDRIWDAAGFVKWGFTNAADFVWTQMNNLGNWLYDNVFKPLRDKLNSVGQAVVSGAQDLFGFFFAALEKVIIGPADQIVETVNFKLSIPGKLVRGEYTSLAQLVEDITDPAPAILAAMAGVVLLPLIMQGLTQAVSTDLIAPLLERPAQEMRQRLGDHLMTLDNIYESWNRGLLPEGEAKELIGRIGYGGLSKQAVEGLRYRLPPLADLTRMAVREVFDPAQRSALTLDADYPAALTAPAKALGLEEMWARNYWAAHWDLPSPSQGYEMLHRGIISEQQLADLLRALDYAPVWRGRLKDISFNPLTRVDIRRMYAARVLNEGQVLKAYKDIGYDQANAQLLTDFTKRNYAPQDATTGVVNRELTAGLIRTAYRRHVITRDDARVRLVEIGYDGEEAEFQLDIDDAQLAQNPTGDSTVPVRDLTTGALMEAYRERVLTRAQVTTELTVLGYAGNEITVLLSLEDLQVSRARRNARADEVHEKYVARTVDYNGALAELTSIGIHPDHGANLLAEWGADFRRGEHKLTVAEVFNALKLKYFTNDQALAYLRRLGYNEPDSAILMRLRGGA
jgi:hypothetical protein